MAQIELDRLLNCTVDELTALVKRNGFERPTSHAPGFPAILAVLR
jgi:hypothetical protein